MRMPLLRRGREDNNAPEPAEAVPPVDEVPDAPDTPLEISKPGWISILKLTFKKYGKDRCSITA
ncbi:MAG: hypothetical protein ABJB47_19920, partial [Actinomycetota bacterium]